MKKTYVKPAIVFDSLSLSDNIAAGCEMISTNSARNQCPVAIPDLGGVTIFIQGASCDMTPPGNNDEICYDIPTASNNVFTS